MNHTAAIALATALVTTSLGLQPAAADERREHGAHVHGLATLNVAREGHALHIELESPAANIFGFEHSPASETERDAVHQAVERLKAGTALFGFPARAACTLEGHTVHSPLLIAAGLGAHGEHTDHTHSRHAHDREAPTGEAPHGYGDAHDHHDHGDKAHAQDSDQKHGHGEDHGDHQAHGTGTHADITATYRFHCEHPARLDRLEIRLFEAFPATKRLRAQYIIDQGQGTADLTPENRFLRF